MMYYIHKILTNKFRPVHYTDDTHHLHSGLELTNTTLFFITPQTLNNLKPYGLNNYPFLAYILILLT